MINDDVISELVFKLRDWLINYADAWVDGDDKAEDLEKLAVIIQQFPTEVNMPESIWPEE